MYSEPNEPYGSVRFRMQNTDVFNLLTIASVSHFHVVCLMVMWIVILTLIIAYNYKYQFDKLYLETLVLNINLISSKKMDMFQNILLAIVTKLMINRLRILEKSGRPTI